MWPHVIFESCDPADRDLVCLAVNHITRLEPMESGGVLIYGASGVVGVLGTFEEVIARISAAAESAARAGSEIAAVTAMDASFRRAEQLK